MGEKEVRQTSETYDEMFQIGGYAGVYDLPYWRTPYYPLYRNVLKELRKFEGSRILEVGCGTGGFAHYLHDRTSLNYQGFDFSAEAIKKARSRCPNPDDFFVGDALSPRSYTGAYDAIVCTEVLEHLLDDLAAIECWQSGVFCVCSVPNFDSPYHERYFRSREEVEKRYASMIDIDNVRRITKPFLNDLSAKNWLRQVRWNRYRARRLLHLCGCASFERVGGWYVFSGVRR